MLYNLLRDEEDEGPAVLLVELSESDMQLFKDTVLANLLSFAVTSSAHGRWRGLLSRVNADGQFTTLTTNPDPLQKIGQVMHDTEDRKLSCLEYGRGMGYRDGRPFVGNVVSVYCQQGNSVPPPLARSVGVEIQAGRVARATGAH
jgi:site-specific DNA-cytosine methylase